MENPGFVGIKDSLCIKRCFSIFVQRESKKCIVRDQTDVRKIARHNGNDKVKKKNGEMFGNGSQRGRNEKDGTSRENFLFAPDKYFNRYSQS